MDSVDVLILGAGPAGLAAAHRCMADGVSFRIVETGQSLENRVEHAPEDLGSGVGGSGLYSDGKLSFYPSAHALWTLPGEQVLRQAYGWLQNMVVGLTTHFPAFPDSVVRDELFTADDDSQFERKNYTSLVLGPGERSELVHRLVAPIRHLLLIGSRIVAISRRGERFEVTLQTSLATERLLASRLILCPGRYGSRVFDAVQPSFQNVFRRFEFGVRIQQPASTFFLKDDPSTDTKLRFVSNDGATEWRTFCCCRDGKILKSSLGNLHTFSGTSSTGSGVSNVGFNCRVRSAELFNGLGDEVKATLAGRISAFTIGLDDFFGREKGPYLYGPSLDQLLRSGLKALASSYDISDAVIRGPCLEGIGYYPRLSSQLEASVPGIYVAGDATGLFRGLVPAFLSGAYAGAQAALSLKRDELLLESGAKIKVSSVDSLSPVFTAQSKQFFYCRDAVCEFVFNRGRLPINPFRVFDYFLGDRVGRDVVRQGNNQLIRSCDELWVFGPLADGVLFEVFLAARLGKPVRFFTIGTRESEIKELESVSELKFEPEVHAPQQTRGGLVDELRRLLDNRIIVRQRTLFD